MRSIFPALFAALLLNGCATHAQREFSAIRANNQLAAAQLLACLTGVYDSPDAAILRPHRPLKLTDATLQQMADTSTTTDSEVAAILAIYPKQQECRKAAIDQITKATPSIALILAAEYADSDKLVLSLIQRKLSWGEYVMRGRDLAMGTQTALLEESGRITAGLSQEHQAELAQRQRAAEALASWAQTQELINAANQPVITNCNAVSNMVNCVSH